MNKLIDKILSRFNRQHKLSTNDFTAYYLNMEGIRLITPCHSKVKGEYVFDIFYSDYVVEFVTVYDTFSWPVVNAKMESLRSYILSQLSRRFILIGWSSLMYSYKRYDENKENMIAISIHPLE